MRCSSKSTTWRVRAVCLVCLCAGASTGARAATEADVREAVRLAVAARLAGATVHVGALRWQSTGDDRPIEARPEPGARLDRPARFTLLASGRRVGFAVATVAVEAPHVRITCDTGRGPLTAACLEVMAGDPGPVLLEALPTMDDAVGSRPGRPLAVGEVVTFAVLGHPMAVRSGETVDIRAVAGRVEVAGRAVALQSGRVGDTIRLVNPESRREVRGRIVARGRVEVWNDER